jgi:hypothetical protein
MGQKSERLPIRESGLRRIWLCRIRLNFPFPVRFPAKLKSRRRSMSDWQKRLATVLVFILAVVVIVWIARC